ncbi:hypothetical protein J3R30DRAFT_3282574 [Lentinula aciculospora]|uniref:Alcohol acetyltransferase n=1 Tax=Lentinula aciculospora TaxID=153920 RepID=A0A9W9ALS9_9AGAR|nr:hypothetical protein J3R30DRAFT_3282574 [Lentinula aciculospora]
MRLQNPTRLERRLGDTETSYFLPSRESGVNDMYLHLGFSAQAQALQRDRVAHVWAILRLKHPLLACSVEMRDYNDLRFILNPYASPEAVLQSADENLIYRQETKGELIDSYLNGPRTLSAQRLSCVIISQELGQFSPGHSRPNRSAMRAEDWFDYDFLLCTTHFIGDGMALHQCANDFFTLLSSKTSSEELHDILKEEWRIRYGSQFSEISLPRSLEERLPLSSGKLQRAASIVDFELSQGRLLGGHSFPRRKGNDRKTVVPTVAFDEDRTRGMLKLCKSRNVSISSALFAICNIAWARTRNDNPHLPVMMYSALNLRPYLSADELNDSYWFIAISYFNVVLPGFLPTSHVEKMFWHRARSAKEQSTRAAKHRMIISRSREMAKERGERARCWAKEDDDKVNGTDMPPPPPLMATVAVKLPSTALIGLSLLGNLDGIYRHAAFPQIRLHTLTTGSRQRSGAMLLFGYTFVGKLWISLGYDENGFEKGVVERFWENVLTAIEELLL